MKTRTLIKLAALAALGGVAGPVLADACPPGNPPTNCGPPSGTAVFDLAGQALPHEYTEYTASFVATLSTTNLTFAFREDPDFWSLSNVSLTTGGGSNLLQNGDFSSGTVGTTAVAGWTAINAYGAAFPGVLDAGCGVVENNCWYDGSVQGYDGLSQQVATTVGTTYTATFFLSDGGSLTTASRLSTNSDVDDEGGNGDDVLLYAGAPPVENGTPPTLPGSPSVPEPATLALLGLGLAGLGFGRRRASKV